MRIRIRKLEGSSKWVAEVGKGCCSWTYIDPLTLDARMPVMPYEDWYLHDSRESALATMDKFKRKQGN